MTTALIMFPAFIAALGVGSYVYAKRLEQIFPPVGLRVDVGGGRIHIVETAPLGEERGVALLVHGASGNFADLHVAIAETLAARGFRVLAFDRPGSGWSERIASRATATRPEKQAEWIRLAAERLGVRRAYVVVHSLAGALGLAMAADAPEFVEGLVLLSPASHPWPGGVSWYYYAATAPVAGKLFRWLVAPWAAQLMLNDGLRSVFMPDATPVEYARRTRLKLMLRPWHFLANAEDVVDFRGHVTRLRPRYRNVRAPTTVVTGDSDRVVYADIHSFGILSDVPGATMRFIRDLGHSPHFSRPEVVVDAIEEVFARATDRRSRAEPSRSMAS